MSLYLQESVRRIRSRCDFWKRLSTLAHQPTMDFPPAQVPQIPQLWTAKQVLQQTAAITLLIETSLPVHTLAWGSNENALSNVPPTSDRNIITNHALQNCVHTMFITMRRERNCWIQPPPGMTTVWYSFCKCAAYFWILARCLHNKSNGQRKSPKRSS